MQPHPQKKIRDTPIDDDFASDRLDALRDDYDTKRENSPSSSASKRKKRNFVLSLIVVGGMVLLDQKIGGSAMWLWLSFCAVVLLILKKVFRFVDVGGSFQELYDAAMNCVRYENFIKDYESGKLEFFVDSNDASFVDTPTWDDFWRRTETYFHIFEHASLQERERILNERLIAAQPAFEAMRTFAKNHNVEPLYWTLRAKN